MSDNVLILERDLVRLGGVQVAVVRCSGIIAERTDLAALRSGLNPETPAVAFVRDTDADTDRLEAMAALGIPCVTGLPVTDATKRVDGDLVTETLDRSTLFTIDLPIIVPVDNVAAASAIGRPGTLHLGELCGHEDAIAVIDPGGDTIARLGGR